MKYTDPDGRIYYIGNEAFVLNPKQENKIYSSLLKKLLGFALIGLGNFLDKGGGVAIAAAVTGVTGGTGAVTAPAIVAGSAVLGKVLEAAGTAIILESCAKDIFSSNVQYSSSDEDTYKSSERIGKCNGKTPRNNQVQNQQVKCLSKKYKLTKDEQEQLHDEITHQGYDYSEIEEIVKEIVKER